MRHFIDLKDFDSDRLEAMLASAAQMKSGKDVSQPPVSYTHLTLPTILRV